MNIAVPDLSQIQQVIIKLSQYIAYFNTFQFHNIDYTTVANVVGYFASVVPSPIRYSFIFWLIMKFYTAVVLQIDYFKVFIKWW